MKNAAEIIQKLRENTDTQSYFMLGYLYEMGELLPRDLDKAIEYYNKASSINVPDMAPLAMKYKIMAHYNSLILQAKKIGLALMDKNIDLSWLEDVEKNGSPEIFYRIGTLFEWGIIFEKNYEMAFKFFSLAYYHKHPDATCRLGGLYGNGNGCLEDENKSQKLFEEAEKLGNPTAKFLVNNREYVTICPNEEWLTRDEVGTYGAIFGNSSGFEMLRSVVQVHYNTLDKKKNFCISKELTSPAEYNIMFFLQKLSLWEVGFATYTVAVYALSRLKSYAQEKQALLSGSAFMMPALFGDSSVIESYVKLYVWAQAWLSRAKILGVDVDNEHISLDKHKDIVEVSCQNIYRKYKIFADKDDDIWQKAVRLVEADLAYRLKNRPLVAVPENIYNHIEIAINNSNIEEYKLWQQCIFDADQLSIFNRRFFNHAVRNKKFDEAKAFIKEVEFEVNYIIDGLKISPLEFLIKHDFNSEACKIIRRANVDVNYNSNIIFSAVMHGNPNIIKALLERHDLKLDVKFRYNNEILTPIELAQKNNNSVAAMMISDHIHVKNNKERQEKKSSAIISDLYFQYSYDDTISIDAFNSHSNISSSSSSSYGYKYKD